ncbi:MAG: PAS domain S-box protein, partial [Ignavibacteriaceae bacterium]
MTNIIIVDDKAENLYLLELLLKGRGYNTISAKNGAEALDLARKDIPNLIISDILMPVMDGFTLCREVKKDKKLYNIPFIFYTATYTDPKDEEFALSLGADRFLLKPLDLKEFIAIVKTVLKEAKKKNIQRIEVPPTAEEVILKEYNEALVRKLEDKMLQTEQAEKEVRKYNIALLREIEEHKRAVEALKKQKDEFETIFNLVPAQIWYKDTHNNFIRVNRQVCTDIGMTNDKIEGHSAEELFPSFAQQYFKDDLEVFNTRKPKLGITEKVNTADGEIRWVLSDKVPVLGNDGEVNGLIAVVQDITERKRTEEKIRETQILLQASIESPKDMIILSIDKNYNYLYYNSVHENFVRTAYGKDLKIGVNLLDCITNDDDRRKAKINYDKALNGFSHATVAEYGDLERYHYETRYNPIYNDKKEIIGATAFSANITERKRAE